MAEESKTEYRTAMEAGMVIANAAAGKGDGSFAFVPAGTAVADLEKYLPVPRRIKATATFENVPSFVAYVNRFKQDSTTIFATPKQAMFGAVLDYHQAPDAPAWGSHIAQLKLQTTEEWAAWQAKNRVQMDHMAFSEFIEDRCHDFFDPKSADVLTIVTALEAKNIVEFKSVVSADNGAVTLEYKQDLKATIGGGTKTDRVDVPKEFKLRIPVFDGQEVVDIEARFRYRIRDAQLTMWYELVRPDLTIKAAVDQAIVAIESGTKIKPLVGSVTLCAPSQIGGQR